MEKETLIQEANQYREKVIPEARATADKLKSDAQVDQLDRINKANDYIAEFNGRADKDVLLSIQHIQDAYDNAMKIIQDVVYERVFRERVTQILNQMGGKIVVPEDGGTPTVFLP